MDQLDHQLSRLALAKAIKQEDYADSWSKSVIFNQPFLKDLQQQKRQRVPKARQLVEQKQIKHTPKSPEPRPKKKKHACIPSDSEESEHEDPLSSEEDNDDDDIVQIVSRTKKLSDKVRTSDGYASSSSPSRGSLASSISLPLTEDDEEDDTSTCKRYPPRHKPMVEPMDPLSLQQMQYYQYQLQLQQQQQQQYYYQQLLAQNAYNYLIMKPQQQQQQQQSYEQLHQQHYKHKRQQQQHQQQQHQQQQQHHYRHHHRQPSSEAAHSSSHSSHSSHQKSSTKKYTNTDIRRRAEMLKSSVEYK